jgi:hypothetical protein
MDDESRAKLVHNVSLAALIVCPLVMALPPRKFDIYTGLLMTGTFLGGNQLAYEYTGRSFLARCKARMQALQSLSSGENSLPEKAKIMQVRLREEREMRDRMNREKQGLYANPGVEEKMEKESAVLDEVRRKREEEEKERKERGIIGKVWMGGEPDDWKAKRDKREREALAEGRGYGGLIMDQIWEVWNWGKDRTEDLKEKDEEVVKVQKEHKAEDAKK